MGFFGKSGKDMAAYVAEARADERAVIVDVRSAQDFAQGHVEGAVSVPLDELTRIAEHAPTTDIPLYVYCLSGMRSARACSQLRAAGYERVMDMGGISSYTGPVVTD
ncbi:MAG: rhodanese-like domain-containing protein [Actinomycetota bacterium]|nr:rhodanese-like domain-containing protein [Actinomycetota bacterium]